MYCMHTLNMNCRIRFRRESATGSHLWLAVMANQLATDMNDKSIINNHTVKFTSL